MPHTSRKSNVYSHTHSFSLSLPLSRYLAANGAIMRTAILGVLEFNSKLTASVHMVVWRVLLLSFCVFQSWKE